MDRILELLIGYSYLILFWGVVVEGEIFPLAAGWLVSLSLLNFYAVVGITFVGAFVGDLLWFAAARHWGRRLVEKYGRWLWFKSERLKKMEEYFARNGKKTLWVTKFIYSFGHSSIIVAGIAKMNWRQFIKIDLPASLLWAFLFTLLGKLLGASFYLMRHLARDLTLAGGGVLLIIIVFQASFRRYLNRQVD